MNADARKVRKVSMVLGVACAVAAALPCAAGESTAPLDIVTVQSQRKSAPAEENIGFFSGLAIGAVAGGPIGAVAGGITGALLGEHYHKQKIANRELAAKLTQTVAELDGTVQLSQAQQAALAGSLDHARGLTLNIAFRTGDANVTTEDIDQLTTLGQLAGSMPGVKIRVSGHTDPRGSEEFNKTLSQDRAETVAAVLENAGLAQDRIEIEAQGAGGVADTGNPDDYAFQRRVSVRLIGGSGDVKVASIQ